MIANPLIKYGIIAFLVISGLGWVYFNGRASGYADCRVEQAAADRKEYAKIIDKIKQDDIDLTDDNAVDDLLRELAGEPESGQ